MEDKALVDNSGEDKVVVVRNHCHCLDCQMVVDHLEVHNYLSYYLVHQLDGSKLNVLVLRWCLRRNDVST